MQETADQSQHGQVKKTTYKWIAVYIVSLMGTQMNEFATKLSSFKKIVLEIVVGPTYYTKSIYLKHKEGNIFC